ncbi:MAG: type III-B CRISPR module RAMP protein Cmr1 [Nitrospiraceae bacterium]|nr:type III-B CRISPR module RAMP protein Cmr1 [Nitrospiraceae bacterium]
MEINLKIEILTPLFLGSATHAPDLRPPSFKGLLRFWYRAVCPKYYENEALFFGSAAREDGKSLNGLGQSRFLLRIQNGKLKRLKWNELQPERFNKGSGRDTVNGLKYLGYPFDLNSKKDSGNRECFAPDADEFYLKIVVLNKKYAEDSTLRRAVAASCWLLFHIGGAGSRNRRGFGSFALMDWACDTGQEAFPELNALPLLAKCRTTAEWRAGFERARSIFHSWFGKFENENKNKPLPHPHLGPGFSYYLSEQGFARWDEAMNEMGALFQRFRRKREPDYSEVKNYLLGKNVLTTTPCRATFGLPLTFRFPRGKEVTILPYDMQRKTTMERQGSLLFFRLATINNRLHPLFIRMDGDVPGLGEHPAAIKSHGRALGRPSENCMDTFMEYLRKEI